MPAGEFAATFDAPGYATETKTVQVTGGSAAVLDVALRAPAASGAPSRTRRPGLRSAGVTITYPGGSTLTDAAGAYAVSGLPSGPSTLTFAATGFDGVERSVDVIAGTDVDVNVAMTPTATYVVGEVRDATTTLRSLAPPSRSRPDRRRRPTAQGRYRVDLPPGTYTVTAVGQRLQPVIRPDRHQRRQLRDAGPRPPAGRDPSHAHRSLSAATA